MIHTAEFVSPKHPDKLCDQYKRNLARNKEWKRMHIERKTKKRWGVHTYTKSQEQEARRKWENTPKGIYSSIKRSCNRHHKGRLEITQKDFITWYNKEEKKCFYCGITQKGWVAKKDTLNKRFKKLTIDRRDNTQKYKMGNLVISCFRCNTIKSDFFTEEEMIEIGNIIKNKKYD